nr:gag protein [Human immunodeficiency virus 1]
MGARASVLSGGELDRWEKIRLRPGGKKKYRLKHIVWASTWTGRDWGVASPQMLHISSCFLPVLGLSG